MCVNAIDTVRVFLPKCPLSTVRSRFSADELQLVREYINFCCLSALKRLLTVVRGTLEEKSSTGISLIRQ